MKIRWWQYCHLQKYTHLHGIEFDLWTDYIECYPDEFDNVAYDTPIRSKNSAPLGSPANLKRDWEYLTAFKIDALGIKNNLCTIIELKDTCWQGSISQILFYKHLLSKQRPELNIQNCTIACRATREDIVSFAETQGVKVIVVPGPGIMLSKLLEIRKRQTNEIVEKYNSDQVRSKYTNRF